MSIIQRYDPDPTASYDIDMIPTPDGPFVSYTDHAAAIAEAREDYANLTSTSGDMLKLAVARAEKAEADHEAYKAREIAVNTWGVLLCDRLGEFLRETIDESGPMTTQIIVSFDGVVLPVVHLWATTDGQHPAARCVDLRASLNDALQRAEAAEAALATANDGLYVKINQSKGTT